MKFSKWHIAPAEEADIRRLGEAGYPQLVSQVLAARGISTAEEAAAFLERGRDLTCSPFLMKDMDRAVECISRAISQGRRMAVFGDYDVDGITATVILVDYLKSRGVDVLHYIPRRIEDGYGLGQDAIRSLHEQGVELLITVDCGITGVEEVDFAASLGMDVVITDHHECKDTLPRAVAVVDPHRPDCTYPFPYLAGCGVALKLVLALGGESREEALFSRYCTLAAIGTIADVMPMSGENRIIVSRGLECITQSDFIGLHALLQEAGLMDKAITSVQVGFVLAPRINAAGRMGAADKAADLLLCQDPAEAARLARELCALNRERQAVEQTIYAQAVEQIDHLPPQERSALVLASDTWHQGVVGIVASRLSEKYACPSFMIHLSGTVGKGSCRSWGGFNLFAALERCSDLLLDFGGHELAAGFTIDVANIPAFRQRMNQLVREYQGGGAPEVCLEIDAALTCPSRVTLTEVEALGMLEPYGAGNARPLFCLMGATLERLQSVGQNRHLKLRLSKGSCRFEAIYFSATAESCAVAAGMRVDAAFYLQVNTFRGQTTLQLQIIDLRPSLTPSRHEAEALELVARCCEGGPLTEREKTRIPAQREPFAACYTALERQLKRTGAESAPELPLLRLLAAESGGSDGFLRAAMALRVFRERGLVQITQGEDVFLTLRLSRPAGKVDLFACPYLRRLKSPNPNGRE